MLKIKHFIFVLLILLVTLFCQAGNIETSHTTKGQLTKKMSAFFSEVLSKNYKGINEQDLYEQFLNDYFEAWTNSDGNKIPELHLKMDGVELMKINNDLFKRDRSHYYYIFPEVIFLKPDDDITKAKELFNRYPEIPIVLHRSERKISNKTSLFADFSKSHNVNLAFPKGFIKDIQHKNLKTVSYINSTMEEVSFYYMAAFFTKPEAKKELQYPIVREIVAVVFWKYLCLQAGVDFYALPNDCNKSFQY